MKNVRGDVRVKTTTCTHPSDGHSGVSGYYLFLYLCFLFWNIQLADQFNNSAVLRAWWPIYTLYAGDTDWCPKQVWSPSNLVSAHVDVHPHGTPSPLDIVYNPRAPIRIQTLRMSHVNNKLKKFGIKDRIITAPIAFCTLRIQNVVKAPFVWSGTPLRKCISSFPPTPSR